MKLYASIIKALREGIRDWKVLILVMVFCPFFVLITKLFYGGEPITYNIGVINSDIGTQSVELLHEMESSEMDNDVKIFHLSYLKDQSELEKKVKNKNIDIGIVIPKDYSLALSSRAAGKAEKQAIVNIYGSMSNSKYTIAAVLANDLIYQQGLTIAKIVFPSAIKETFLDKTKSISVFDSFVPGLISMGVLMIMFSTTSMIVKENDKKTLIRLKLSRLGAFNILTGISIVQAMVAILAVIITYWFALFLGYKPAGNFFPILVVGVISSFSMVAISLLVASFLNTMVDVLTIGCFPLFILMFFSGCMFPVPKMTLFTIAGTSFGITDVLPLTHTVNAFNKILNYGAGLSEVTFEMMLIIILTLIYFVIGVALYQKRKLSKA